MFVSEKAANKLINEKSPYLLQHAHNPVDWYPWGEEAFAKAKKEDKMIFLSIGYSTCHWCHVMEKESFSDISIAEILNKNFVCIKVDREERPDIDHIYMKVCQAVSDGGGWPLSVFMTYDCRPFFVTTYMPATSSYGLRGFPDVLNYLMDLWANNREKIFTARDSITSFVFGDEALEGTNRSDDALIDYAFTQFEYHYSNDFGGLRGAPKFPQPHNILFLLRYKYLTNETRALEMAEKTLVSMYKGGIYDHIGYGFCRYSTDEKWIVPHFEKMLYDNALLIIAYAEAFQVTKKPFYKRVASEIVEFVAREMTCQNGGFYTAIDADSEGEEGKFYTWSKQEIMEVLGDADGKLFCDAYNIKEVGSFNGKNIPNLVGNEIKNLKELEVKLLVARNKRQHPLVDDKILTGQNGMMIAALSLAGRILNETKYIDIAEKAADFIMAKVVSKDGRLLARYRDGESAIKALSFDYSYLIWGFLQLFTATGNSKYLYKAEELNSGLLKYFWDEHNGGLFVYGSDAEKLLDRPKNNYDGAFPSSNSIGAINFIWLGQILGNEELIQKAKQIISNFKSDDVMGCLHLINALMYLKNESSLVLSGNVDSEGFSEMKKLVNQSFLPFTSIKYDAEGKYFKLFNKKATAYICSNFTCLDPITSIDELSQAIIRLKDKNRNKEKSQYMLIN